MIEYDWIAHAQARRYRGYVGGAIDLDDLVQEGRLGIMHGMPRYREGAGASRKTWASLWARSYIHRYVEQHLNSVRMPTGADVGRRKSQIRHVPTCALGDLEWSLGAPSAEPRECLLEQRLDEAMADLPERWRYLLTQRYWADRTLQSIAGESGCTRQAIENVTRRALRRLRSELATPTTVQQRITARTTGA